MKSSTSSSTSPRVDISCCCGCGAEITDRAPDTDAGATGANASADRRHAEAPITARIVLLGKAMVGLGIQLIATMQMVQQS